MVQQRIRNEDKHVGGKMEPASPPHAQVSCAVRGESGINIDLCDCIP